MPIGLTHVCGLLCICMAIPGCFGCLHECRWAAAPPRPVTAPRHRACPHSSMAVPSIDICAIIDIMQQPRPTPQRLALQMLLASLLLMQLVGPGGAASIAETLLSDKLTAETLLQVRGGTALLLSCAWWGNCIQCPGMMPWPMWTAVTFVLASRLLHRDGGGAAAARPPLHSFMPSRKPHRLLPPCSTTPMLPEMTSEPPQPHCTRPPPSTTTTTQVMLPWLLHQQLHQYHQPQLRCSPT